jgi:hypothetical protein
LPGSDEPPIEIGSGVWHWSVPYQDPDARGPYTVDDLIGDIAFDHAARGALMGVLDRVEAPDFLKRILFNERNIPLRQALSMLPNHEETINMMNNALTDL